MTLFSCEEANYAQAPKTIKQKGNKKNQPSFNKVK